MVERPEAIAEAVLPLDGPYPAQQLAAAAEVMAELARRLTHATLAHNVGQSLPKPQALDTLVRELDQMPGSLAQTLRQIAGHLRRGADDPALSLDEDAGEHLTPAAVALLAAEHLGTAAGHVEALGRSLAQARASTARLRVRRTGSTR
jgi:hypothetical protein